VLGRLLILLLLLLPACSGGAPEPVRLAFTDGGQGPVVVLLHGHPQTGATWREVAGPLRASSRVLVIDQRGQGSSPAPQDGYDAATRAEDVAALLRSLDVRGATVVGTDLGGHTAFALARDFPDLVGRLAVLEAVIPGTRAASGPLSSPHIARHADVDAMVATTREREREHVEDFVCGDRQPCPYPVDLLDTEAAALRLPGHLRGAFAPYVELDGDVDDPGRVDQPVLAVGGARGIGGAPAASLREVAADVTEVVLPDATHWLAEEHPQALLAALRPFLAAAHSGQALSSSMAR
jgi:pimeloyl-ACP methyl ester carboxylesterase